MRGRGLSPGGGGDMASSEAERNTLQPPRVAEYGYAAAATAVYGKHGLHCGENATQHTGKQKTI